jgi:hypothetical protein
MFKKTALIASIGLAVASVNSLNERRTTVYDALNRSVASIDPVSLNPKIYAVREPELLRTNSTYSRRLKAFENPRLSPNPKNEAFVNPKSYAVTFSI